MARNEYYTYKDSPINGDIMMSVQVFDIITKQVAAEDKDIKLDTSKGFSVTGTKNLVNCTIKVYITVHVRIKYGTNITAKTKELQKKIASGIKEMAAVTVKSVDVVVEAIDF